MKEFEKPDKKTVEAGRKEKKSRQKYKKSIGSNKHQLLIVAVKKARMEAGIPYDEKN